MLHLNIWYWKAEIHLKSISVRPVRILTVNVPAKVIIVNQAKQSENLVNNVPMMMMNDMDGDYDDGEDVKHDENRVNKDTNSDKEKL